MQYVKLNTNESPYPPSPAVLAAANARQAELLRLYPDPTATPLRAALAARYGLAMQNVFIGNGSDEVLNFAFMAFAGGDTPAYFPDISYGFYPVFAQLHGIRYTELPLRPDFTVSWQAYYGRDGMLYECAVRSTGRRRRAVLTRLAGDADRGPPNRKERGLLHHLPV